MGHSSGTVAPASIHGVMFYELRSGCNAWRITSTVLLKTDLGGSGDGERVRNFSAWERKDGLKFRFQLRESRDGKTEQQVKGVAFLEGKGGLVS